MVPDGLAGAQTSSLDCSAEIQLFLFSKGKRRWDHARTTLENSLSTLENSRSTRNQAQFVKHVAMTCYGCISRDCIDLAYITFCLATQSGMG